MTNRMMRAGIALAIGLGLALLASSQTPKGTATPAVSPTASRTPIIPSSVLTPGSASLTPAYRYSTSPATGLGSVLGSTTPGYASNLYSIPETTPSDVPAYSSTPGGRSLPRGERMVTATTPAGGISPPALRAPTTAPRRPTSLADCGPDAWRSYSGPRFKSQKDCESWVNLHVAAGSPSTTGSKKEIKKTGYPRTTPSAASPVEATTPGSSITPFLNPTPGPR